MPSLQSIRDAAQAAQSGTTAIAVMVGGFWAYFSFGRKRERFPRLHVSYEFDLVPLNETLQLLRVKLLLENFGGTLVTINSITNRIQQVLPLAEVETGTFVPAIAVGESEIRWPLLDGRELPFTEGHREIEPGEVDELHFDYLLGTEPEVLIVYSYVRNVAKRKQFYSRRSAPPELGWMKTQIIQLQQFRIQMMKPTPDHNRIETRQGTPVSAPVHVAQGGGTKQGTPTPPPVPVKTTKK